MIMPDEASRASELLLMLRRVWARPPDLTGAGVSCGAQRSGRLWLARPMQPKQPDKSDYDTRTHAAAHPRRGSSPAFRLRKWGLRGTLPCSRARSAGSLFVLDAARQRWPPLKSDQGDDNRWPTDRSFCGGVRFKAPVPCSFLMLQKWPRVTRRSEFG